MKRDTKIYSEFIKRNKINTAGSTINMGSKVLQVYRDGQGWWYTIGNDAYQHGSFLTKKSAVYYAFKNHCENVYKTNSHERFY